MSESNQNDKENDAENGGETVYRKRKSYRPDRVAEAVLAGRYRVAPYRQAVAADTPANDELSLAALYQEIGESMERATARLSAINSDVRVLRHEIASTHLHE